MFNKKKNVYLSLELSYHTIPTPVARRPKGTISPGFHFKTENVLS